MTTNHQRLSDKTANSLLISQNDGLGRGLTIGAGPCSEMCSERPRVLDLFCGAGGASYGLHLAGFDVTGVDINPQPHYLETFIQADALTWKDVDSFDFIWASPPCQAYSWSGKRWNVPRQDLIDFTRQKLIKSGVPFVIENVPGAPLQRDFMLCGEMFGLGVIRHRYFEVGNGFACIAPAHPQHLRPVLNEDGLQKSAYACVAGHGGEGYTYRLDDWRIAMGIEWMTREELVESIPPAYSRFIGKQAIQFLRSTSAVSL